MILYLTSSPCVTGADRALLTPENGFSDALRRDLPNPVRCLYVASSPDDRAANLRYSADIRDAFREAGVPFAEMQILQRENQASAGELVRRSNLIVLAGGHVPTQNAFFQDADLAKHLYGYKGVILGISAGTMNSAAMVYVQPECPGESLDPQFRRFLPGLGLTYLNILPHYHQEKDSYLDGKRLYEDITYPDSMGHRFLLLPDGSYVRSENGQSRLFGEAYCLEDGVLQCICGNGQSLLL